MLRRGLASPVPALVSLRTQSRATGALQPGGTGAFRKKERKSHHWLELLEARTVFALNTETSPLSAALASPLPIFGLFLEEPVPQPRVAEAVTRVSPAAGTLSPATLPSRTLFHLRPRRPRSRPCGGRPAGLGLQLGCGDEVTSL